MSLSTLSTRDLITLRETYTMPSDVPAELAAEIRRRNARMLAECTASEKAAERNRPHLAGMWILDGDL